MNSLIDRFKNCYRYKDLIIQLVQKDVKLKYRRSFLGYVWSILNPLLIMLVMVIVFTNMFRFEIPNYPVYLLIGQTCFNFLSESTNQAMFSIVGNAALLKKTYVPKYIFTISRVSSSMVNMLFAMGALVLVCFICKIKLNWYMLFIPVVVLQLYVFCMGVGLFLAQASVYFRDVQHIYGAVLTAWMYLTPIFYPAKSLPVPLLKLVKYLNPMYSYITQFRTVVLEACMPDAKLIIYGTGVALGVLLFGTWSFYKTQDNFILYI